MRAMIYLLFCLPHLVFALTIGTYNIRNFDYDVRYRINTDKPALSKILKELNFDLLNVQEINNTKAFEEFVINYNSQYDAILSQCGGAHGQRLGFIFNTKKLKLLNFSEDLTFSNPNGLETCDSGSRPAAIAIFEDLKSGKKFYAITVHLKSGSSPEARKTRYAQYKKIEVLIKKLTSGAIKDYFIAGDFNTTGYSIKDGEEKVFDQLTKDINGINLTKSIGCSAYWWGGVDDGHEAPSHLDHIIVSKTLPQISTSQIKTSVNTHCKSASCLKVPTAKLGQTYAKVSDHCPITSNIH